MSETPPHERIQEWDEEKTHRIEVSPRMLKELLAYGTATSAGTSEFGPELVVLDYVDPERLGPKAVSREVFKQLHALESAFGGEVER